MTTLVATRSMSPACVGAGVYAALMAVVSVAVLITQLFWAEAGSIAKGLMLAMLFVALRWPNVAIGLFLLSIPILGGNKPATFHTTLFLQLFLGLLAGMSVWWLKAFLRRELRVRFHFEHPVAFFLLLFVLIAAISLISVSFDPLLFSLLYGDGVGGWVLGQHEFSALYPFATVAQLFLFLHFFFMMTNFPHTYTANYRLWVIALVSGIVITAVFGILDHYWFLKLDAFRPLDGGARLQAFFANPNWVSQYLILTFPFVTGILLLRLSSRWALFFMLAAISLTEYVIILTMSRTAWIAYPLVALITWFSFYVLRSNESTAGLFLKLKKSLVKILLTVPATVIVSVVLITSINSNLESRNADLETYKQRFLEIRNTSNRTGHWLPSINLTSLAPVYGHGNESFATRFLQHFRASDGVFRELKDPTGCCNWGTTHNFYLQQLTGKGLMGLASYLVLLFVAVRSIWFYLRRQFISADGQSLSHDQRIVLMIVGGYLLSLVIYSGAQSTFYIISNGFMFFFVLSLLVALVPPAFTLSKKVRLYFVLAIVLAIPVHFLWTSGLVETTTFFQPS